MGQRLEPPVGAVGSGAGVGYAVPPLALGLLFELPPLLLGPAELLHGGGQIEEVDRHDGGPGAEVGVADEGV